MKLQQITIYKGPVTEDNTLSRITIVIDNPSDEELPGKIAELAVNTSIKEETGLKPVQKDSMQEEPAFIGEDDKTVPKNDTASENQTEQIDISSKTEVTTEEPDQSEPAALPDPYSNYSSIKDLVDAEGISVMADIWHIFRELSEDQKSEFKEKIDRLACNNDDLRKIGLDTALQIFGPCVRTKKFLRDNGAKDWKMYTSMFPVEDVKTLVNQVLHEYREKLKSPDKHGKEENGEENA